MGHISFLLESIPAGGVERVHTNLANELASRGHDVEFIVAREEGRFVDELDEDVQLINLDVPRLSGIGTFVWMKRLRDHLDGAKSDYLISGKVKNNLLATVLTAALPTETIIIEHVHIPSRTQESMKSKIYYTLAQHIYPRADEIVAVSNGVRDELVNIGIDRDSIHVLPNPAVPSELIGSNQDNDSTAKILALGRLEPHKNFDMVIEAFEKLDFDEEVVLEIAGTGSEEDKLERIIHEKELTDRVNLVGYVENPYEHMRKADVFVFSSTHGEGLPTVIIEALACGCQVVSTDCPTGPREILKNGKYGFLTPIDNGNAMSQAIGEALKNPLPDSKIFERANHYSVETAVNQYEDLLS